MCSPGARQKYVKSLSIDLSNSTELPWFDDRLLRGCRKLSLLYKSFINRGYTLLPHRGSILRFCEQQVDEGNVHIELISLIKQIYLARNKDNWNVTGIYKWITRMSSEDIKQNWTRLGHYIHANSAPGFIVFRTLYWDSNLDICKLSRGITMPNYLEVLGIYTLCISSHRHAPSVELCTMPPEVGGLHVTLKKCQDFNLFKLYTRQSEQVQEGVAFSK